MDLRFFIVDVFLGGMMLTALYIVCSLLTVIVVLSTTEYSGVRVRSSLVGRRADMVTTESSNV